LGKGLYSLLGLGPTVQGQRRHGFLRRPLHREVRPCNAKYQCTVRFGTNAEPGNLLHKEPIMTLYGGIDVHANHSMIVLLDDQDQVVLHKRLPNQLDAILQHLTSYRPEIVGLVVESTDNWYW
jgi:hypothetical protein